MSRLEVKHGNLLQADVDALVNTVNTEGVMGKGVALQFRQAFPANYRAYKKACSAGSVKLGKMFVYDNGGVENPKFIINFPTKGHWRSKSKLSDIEAGLDDLVRVITELGIKSIAIPPLGCGNGGLKWTDVRPRIEKALTTLNDGVEIWLYPPEGAPDAAAMPVRTKRPQLTRVRASIVGLLGRYAQRGVVGLTRLEVQKLPYLLQTAGEPLRLDFIKGKFGPYSEKLNHVLQDLEGHYVRGYGDRTEPSLLVVQRNGLARADQFMSEKAPEALRHCEEVLGLIEGFESPYGLELLTTVHWVATHEPKAKSDPAVAIAEVKAWSTRKMELFQDDHIRAAWERLNQSGWLDRVA